MRAVVEGGFYAATAGGRTSELRSHRYAAATGLRRIERCTLERELQPRLLRKRRGRAGQRRNLFAIGADLRASCRLLGRYLIDVPALQIGNGGETT